jgi:1,4-dihydroxy-2-naphthoate polyprenyltransferase
MNIQGFAGFIRAPFLLLTPMCVLLGIAVAVWEGRAIDAAAALLVMIGALAAHISVNALNEYFDFKSGLDLRTLKTPFSGGSGTLVDNPEFARPALLTGLAALAVTLLVGLWLLLQRGWALLPIGLLGIAIIAGYTHWINRNRFLCLLAPGVGFGPLMVLGTYYVLAGTLSTSAVAVSLIPFFLVNNLLLLNQFPDIEADRSVGRENIPIFYGLEASVNLYGLFVLCAFLVLPVAILLGWLPWYVLLAAPLALLAGVTTAGARRAGDDIEKLLPYMRSNVLVALITPLLVSIALLVSPHP